jgi:hypothetical protein
MGKINAGRVLVGGLLAGLVICCSEFFWNGVVFRADIEAAMAAINRTQNASSSGAMALYVGWSFLVGILAVWVYAAVRPRFGAGPRTALRTGLLLWLLVYVQSAISLAPMAFMPPRLMMLGLAATLPEIVLATLAGARLYKEDGAA